MERISSRQNPLVRRFRELSSGEAANPRDVLLDGEHLVREALASRVPIEVAAFRVDAVDPAMHALADEIAREGGRIVQVTAAVLAAMSPVREPSGVVAIASLPRATLPSTLEQQPQLVFLLHGVQDPGNVGAIVRASEACGATGIVAGEGCADPYGWKALRGSMGSSFRVPVAHKVPLDEAARVAKARHIQVLAAVPRGGDALPTIDLRQPVAVLLGGEGPGLPDPLISAADGTLSVPMRTPVESLNVSIAAALIAYEASRQRAGVHHESVR
jgi:RNA methyltransferase, TrmH family